MKKYLLIGLASILAIVTGVIFINTESISKEIKDIETKITNEKKSIVKKEIENVVDTKKNDDNSLFKEVTTLGNVDPHNIKGRHVVIAYDDKELEDLMYEFCQNAFDYSESDPPKFESLKEKEVEDLKRTMRSLDISYYKLRSCDVFSDLHFFTERKENTAKGTSFVSLRYKVGEKEYNKSIIMLNYNLLKENGKWVIDNLYVDKIITGEIY